MRKYLFMLIVLSVLLLGVKPVSAQIPDSYESSINVTNVSDSAGTITLTFYNQDGTIEDTLTEAIAAYETKWYSTLPVTDFDGSMVISSSVPLASMGMLKGQNAVGTSISYASYVGASDGNPTVYLPLLMKDNYGFNTFYYVQNTSSANVDVTVEYSDGTGTSISGLKPGASAKIDNYDETHSETHFAAELNATGNIAVVVVEYSDDTIGKQLYSYNGFGLGATNPIFPLINENNYGYWTSANIQNIGTVDTEVTLTYTPSLMGTACTETQTIPAGEKRDFASYAFRWDPTLHGYPYPISTTCTLGETFVGSAVVTTNSNSQPLVGIVNQLNQTDDPNKGAALMSRNVSLASDMVVYPYLQQWFGSQHWWTSWTIINVSGSTLSAGDISCHVTGSNSSGPVDTNITNPEALADGEGWLQQFYWDQGPLGVGFIGGAVCTSSSGDIVGTMNILGEDVGVEYDALGVYEGINP